MSTQWAKRRRNRPPLVSNIPTAATPGIQPQQRARRRHNRPPLVTTAPSTVAATTAAVPRLTTTSTLSRTPTAAQTQLALYQGKAAALGFPNLRWTRAWQPTLASLEPLRNIVPPHIADFVLAPPIAETAVEADDGRGLPAAFLPHPSDSLSLDVNERRFLSLIAPAAQAVATRSGYHEHWRSYVTFAFVSQALDRVLPTTASLLHSYLWSLYQVGLQSGSITLHIYSILDIHERHGYPRPVATRTVKKWIDAFARLRGTPKREKLPIRPHHLRAILDLPRQSLTDVRNTAITVLGTLCAMRPSEITQLDVCDALFDLDCAGVLAIRVKKRKNDQRRAGLWPRCGRAATPRHDIQLLLRLWLSLAGLSVTPGCEKERYPRSACRACGRLFTRVQGSSGAIYPVGHRLHGITKATVTDAVNACMRRIGIDVDAYSSVSMRRGGLSAAVEANVPSELYQLQSGHRSDAWKQYVQVGQTDQLLRFYNAFHL